MIYKQSYQFIINQLSTKYFDDFLQKNNHSLKQLILGLKNQIQEELN